MQTGMQVSPQVWRRFVKPAWKRVIEREDEDKEALRELVADLIDDDEEDDDVDE